MSTAQLNASAPVLSPAVGYGIVLGMGLGFAVLMLGITTLTTRYSAHSASESSEEYTSASRSLKPGLIASGIVSAATWAATLLQASTVCLVYGLSGPWWYAAGSSTQIMAFAQNAIQLKASSLIPPALNAPGAHTFLEVIGVRRWGTVCHLSFMFFGLGTSTFLTSQLITGGANTVNALTGMNTLAACFLIPVGVVIYTLVGGLRATFFSDYIHTVVIFSIILAVSFSTFATNDTLGSPSKVYDLLQTAALNYPVGNAAGGSYTTMRSLNGFVFGVVVMVSGSVYMDQTYWQRAVASKASTSVKGYILGGLAFLPVPWMFATAAGLAMISLSAGPSSPFQPISLDHAGVVAPAAMTALLGKSGAILLLIALFLAVTSAASAELVAVSSIITYDVYKRYFNPHATDKEILRMSHVGVIGFGLFMGILGVIFFEIGISLSWLCGILFEHRFCTGTFASAGVFPVGLAIRSRRAKKSGCLAGLWIGFTCGIAAWLATAKGYGGAVDVTTTGGVYEQLAGNAGSFFIAAIVSMTTTFLFPANFDFETTRRKNAFQPEDEETKESAAQDADHEEKPLPEDLKDDLAQDSETAHGVQVQNDAPDAVLYKDFVLSVWLTIGIFVVLCIVVPALMVIPRIWSKAHLLLQLRLLELTSKQAGFTFYIVLAFLWTFFAAFVVVVYPLWESRGALWQLWRGILGDLALAH
ncbi:solute symporter family transporter [Mycena albidolilacea]|uniref:Solute symporter family transporter n=1 Tax=Mycena albidolilacea TaxID=1033008 RepID=A0AAD7A0Y9_9AGAR|nr:solute symporter family transporter [Mycena albidolilacea]